MSRGSYYARFYLGFAALLVALHVPFLRMPFHWDELGQFVPAALDIYRDGAWVPHSTLANVHPPGLMALLALVWRGFGYSILASRLTMLAIAAGGALCAFLLAIRLSQEASRHYKGAPAFAAVMLLIAAPIFEAQSMMVLLDLPAMVLTTLALLLFLQGRYAVCAAVATALVLVKETAVTTPLFFAAWLLFAKAEGLSQTSDRHRREAAYFAAPLIALGVWLAVLHHSTGHWLGNAEFARFNVTEALAPRHIAGMLVRRLWFLFFADGHFLGTLALILGWRVLRGRDWHVAFGVAIAQALAVTVLGGAGLERYLLPVLPIFYAAVAAAALVYPVRSRWASHAVMLVFLVAGWYLNPPYPFPYENNLSVSEFTALQKDAANYLEAYAPQRRVASAWPFTDAILHPEFGYVDRPLQIVKAEGFALAQLADVDRGSYDLLVVYSREGSPAGGALRWPIVREFVRNFGYRAPATPEEIESGLGLEPVIRIERRSQWVQIYAKRN